MTGYCEPCATVIHVRVQPCHKGKGSDGRCLICGEPDSSVYGIAAFDHGRHRLQPAALAAKLKRGTALPRTC